MRRLSERFKNSGMIFLMKNKREEMVRAIWKALDEWERSVLVS